MLKTCDKEKPLAVQIFGSDVEAIAYASKYVSEFADIVDINMGCPAPKVVKNGDGSRLLLNLELVKQIIETKNLTNRYILVEPAVNFDKLETVLVIIK